MSDEDHTIWKELLSIADARRRGVGRALGDTAVLTGHDESDLFALYGAIACAPPPGRFVVAHLGQSLDGCIATASGHSLYVTGQANLVHLHRLRALSDAIVVGANTVIADDPRLTTRLVEGPSPVRVVLDRNASVPTNLGVFRDGHAKTLLVCSTQAQPENISSDLVVRVPEVDGKLSLSAVCSELEKRGLRVLFIEGGGITVTRFVQASLVHRLHVAIAPVLIGDGIRGMSLPSAEDMPGARRPHAQVYRMGDDLLWDLDMMRSSIKGSVDCDLLPRLLR